MGRKGASKRKPSQTKSKPLSGKDAGGSISSVMQATENQPAKSLEPSQAVPSTKGGLKPSSDSKKKNQEGLTF